MAPCRSHRQAGRTKVTQERGVSARKPRRKLPVISTYIRQEGVEVNRSSRTHIRRKHRIKLAKYAASVGRASVCIGDLNGPRGAIDHVCRIKVALSGLPSVVYERRAPPSREPRRRSS